MDATEPSDDYGAAFMNDWLFGEPTRVLSLKQRHPEAQVSATTSAWWRNAERRVTGMIQRYGPGPDGQTCKGCVSLRHMGHRHRRFLKCQRYGSSASTASDWRAGWPACGAYEASPPQTKARST